jgi:glycosyltransferase involved in cell wall biosynthesis
MSAHRWRLSQAVREALLASRSDSLLISAYRLLRRVPGIGSLWRLIDRSAHVAWMDPDRYAAAGGLFAAVAPSRARLPAPVAFDHPEVFIRLLERIRACREPLRPETPVVIVNNGLSAGGAERQILATLAGLQAHGVRAVFLGERLTGVPGQDFHLARAMAAGLDVRQLPRLAAPGDRLYEQVSRPIAEQLALLPPHFILEILDMTRELRQLKPEVLHLWQDETSIKHAISGLIAGVPRIILSGRNVNPTHFGYFQPYMKPAYRALAAMPEVIFSNNSHAGAASYAQWLGLPAERFTVVHNAFLADQTPPADGQERHRLRLGLGAPGDAPLILGVFRLSDEKRPLLWIDSAAAALKLDPNLRFRIAGEGEMMAEAQARIEALGLADAIRLLGARQDVGALYRAADLLLLTSRQEGLPNALLEAQQTGLRVLTTLAGGSAEAVLEGVTGHVTSEEAPDRIADRLLLMLADTALAQSAAAEGPAFVEQRFGAPRMIRDTLALYGFSNPGQALT